MEITRRKFIGTAAALSAVAAYGNRSEAKATVRAAPAGVGVKEVEKDLVRYFSSNGFSPTPPAPIATGLSFNGGLNYDEIFPESKVALYMVQSCARPEDVQKKAVAGTLPFFHIFGYLPKPNSPASDQVKLVLTYLTQIAHLDPKKLRVTSTELVNPLIPTLLALGIGEEQIRRRPLEEAKRDGAGSGFFNPPGHPRHPAEPTLSIEYSMPNGNEIELAEIGYLVAPSNQLPAVGGGLGIERLTMAMNNRYMLWNDGLPKFKSAAQEDARRSKKALPSGYSAILGRKSR